MRILVDADACPVNDIIIRVAKKYSLKAIFITDTAHVLSSHDENVEVLIMDKGRDSVDFALINRLEKGDVVITGDYGVATMALARGAYVLNHNGKRYTNENIDFMLMNRHIARAIRQSGGKTPRIKKRTIEQNNWFEDGLVNLIAEHLNE
ncbi:YaiI/YqxD family protein [Vallitalea okinawensis]|uniref:YaiI/YqxD family protein n=1 Tax=Vallitalea okinawensis TaxID=2078660 RepID=UPI000CFC0FCC|nr:YaiI/YqxD family protein [Vallitalea okinawensis]